MKWSLLLIESSIEFYYLQNNMLSA